MEFTFGVMGGDARQTHLADELRRDGAVVYPFALPEGPFDSEALERAAAADVVILPMPLSRNGMLGCAGAEVPLKKLFACLRPSQRIFAGRVSADDRAAAAEFALEIEDYFLREELTVANAAATAEAAVVLTLEHTKSTLFGKNALVLGFGRIGKLLACRLRSLGCDVTATARKREDLAWIRAYGYRAQNAVDLSGRLSSFDLVFNTVPALVMGKELLEQLQPHCLCMELASFEGIDAVAARELGLDYLLAGGLPGRMVPAAAGCAIKETIYHILSDG